jgi:putative transposase
MPNRPTAHQLYVHITWCTGKRTPLIDPVTKEILHKVIEEICQEFDVQIIAFEAVNDLVHLLIRFHPSQQLSKLVQVLKGRSSRLITRQTGQLFEWEKGYGVDTVGLKALKTAISYVKGQRKRHEHLSV